MMESRKTETKKSSRAAKKTNRPAKPGVGIAAGVLREEFRRARRGLFLALALAAVLGVQCTLGSNDCRRERDDAALCALVAVDTARLCSTNATANNQSTASCQAPLLGALLVCPLTVSDACQ